MDIFFSGELFERIEKNKIGEGAQGAVYKGEWHGQEAAFKTNKWNLANWIFIDPTVAQLKLAIEEVYKLKQIATNDRSACVLFPMAHYRQTYEDEDVSDVYVYPLCEMDLAVYLDKYKPAGLIIKQIFIQCASSIKFISSHGFRHNDVKPKNYLIRHEDGLVRVYLSDFGFEGEIKGGTPLFSSPECFLGTEVELSDIYSLGKTFLYSLMEPKMFRYFVTFPVDYEDDKIMNLLYDALVQLPFTYYIKRMLDPNPANRPRIDDVIVKVKELDLDEKLQEFQIKLQRAFLKVRTSATYELEHHMQQLK